MAYFGNTEQVYETLGQLMQDAATSGGLGPQLQQTNASIQLKLSEPAATITLAFAEGQIPIVAFGDSDPAPGLTLEMSADTAHEMFLGKLNFFEAAGDGRIVRDGASASFAAVWPAAEFALPARYAQILATAGYGELASVS